MKFAYIYILLFLFTSLFFNSCTPSFEELQRRNQLAITSFKFEAANNPKLSKDITLTIQDNKITGYLTEDIDLQSLVPTFTLLNGKLYHEGIQLHSGDDSQNYESTIKLELKNSKGVRIEYSVDVLAYTGLPVVLINTTTGQFVKDKTNWIPAYIKVDGMGLFESYEDSTYVKGRGNGSWNPSKKGFNIKLGSKNEILGMPKHKRWAFLPNYADRTLLRNNTTLHIGREIMTNLAWTPNSQHVEVIFNGKHMGNFLLTEHIRVDKNRVNIQEISLADSIEERVTGGYLLEFDSYFDEPVKFRSLHYNLPINLKNPEVENTLPQHKEYIQAYINNLESALVDGKYEEVYEYLDIHSTIDLWMTNALVGNIEVSYPRSVYFYKDREKKLCAGPLWDFDFSTYANSYSSFNGRNSLLMYMWWYKDLFKDPYFIQTVKQRFAQIKPQLEKVPEYIREKSKQINKSADLNFQIWDISHEQANGDESLQHYNTAIDIMIDNYEGRLQLLETTINNL